MKSLSILVACTLSTTFAPAATLVGLWEFNNSANLGQATVGSDLTVHGTLSSVAGVGGGDGAASVPTASWLTAINPIGANGASGIPTRTNQFTIVMDFRAASLPNFSALLDFDGGSDGDYFIRKSGGNELGTQAFGYTGSAGTITTNTWYRLVLSIDNGVVCSTYVNGVLAGNHAATLIDGTRTSLASTFDLFYDPPSNGEKTVIEVSNVALYNGALTAQDVATLGAVGSAVPEPSVALLGAMGALGLMRRRR